MDLDARLHLLESCHYLQGLVEELREAITRETDPRHQAQLHLRLARVLSRHFLQGARAAYEMVFDAFVKGDKQTLKMLLSDTLCQEFSRELDARKGQETQSETTLVSVKAKDITNAVLDRNTARLTVHFESEQVTVVRNSKGEIVEGNPSDIHHVEDHWVFERDVTSKNPNWKIIET